MITGVPYDAEIEYLESTGTQWIEAWSGVTDNTFGLLAEFSCDYTDDNYPAGFSTTNGKRFLFWGPYNTTWHYGWGNISTSLTTPGFPLSQYPNRADVFYRASVNYLNSGVVTFADDTPYQLPTVPNFTNTDFRLFRSFSTPVKCRFKFAIVSKGAAIVRDFIPVRVGSGANAVGYMYDRMTRKLFGNAGTGSFILGPDVATPVMGIYAYPEEENN